MTKLRAADDDDSTLGDHLAQLIRHGFSPAGAQATIEIDRVMTHIRQSMARREIGRMALRDLNLGIDMADLEIISAVTHGPGEDGEITVGLVAERLRIDPSRASRIVAEAVDKGILRRVASQADARRIGLELTDLGRQHSQAIQNYKWSLFAQALGQWPEEDLVTFARLFQRFSHWVADAKAVKGKS
jgi:DNA-binding MarR family transcriptional regulator